MWVSRKELPPAPERDDRLLAFVVVLLRVLQSRMVVDHMVQEGVIQTFLLFVTVADVLPVRTLFLSCCSSGGRTRGISLSGLCPGPDSAESKRGSATMVPTAGSYRASGRKGRSATVPHSGSRHIHRSERFAGSYWRIAASRSRIG